MARLLEEDKHADKESDALRSIRPDLPGSHDDLGADPEQRKSESDDLRRQFDAPSAPEPDLKEAEESAGEGLGASRADQKEADQIGKGYREERAKGLGRLKNRLGQRWSSTSKGKKSAIAAAGVLGAGGIITAALSLFSLLGIFRLDHFLNNIESKAFIRYQVDMEGRSSKWINSYLTIRMGEVEDPQVRPADRDNILFRSNRVDTNSPLTDWYKTMRASKFEAEVFEKHGIKITSKAYRDGNQIKYRPAIITIRDLDAPIEMRLGNAAMNALEAGDISRFNGALSNLVDVEVLESDKAGRKAVKRIVKDNTKPYQFIKRFYIRKAIQNMTGIRDWRFFEKTRKKWEEKKTSIRNKIITKSLPDSTRLGRIAQCVFAVPDAQCGKNTDPNNPQNQSDAARGGATATIDVDSDSPDKIQQAVLRSIKIGGKLAGPASLLFLIDALSNVDKSIKGGSLVAAVAAAKTAQAVGMYTQFGIARDQIHTGEVNTAEVGEFMQVIDDTGKSEGWNSVVAGNSVTGGRAKEKQCEPKNREKIDGSLGEVKNVDGMVYHCPQDKIGDPGRAEWLQDAWNKSIGGVLQPVFAVYEKIPLVSQLVDKANEIIAAVLEPVIKKLIEVLGLGDDVDRLMAFIFEKAMNFLGGGPLLAEGAPDAIWANHVLQGGAASAESAMRFSGGAETTTTSQIRSSQQVAAYLAEQEAQRGTLERYFALSNPSSVAAKSLFAVSSPSMSNTLNKLANSPKAIFNNLLKPVEAADSTNGYEAARFGGIQTYDMPAECTNSNPLDSALVGSLEKQTNADDMGLIPADELTWELMQDSNEFYKTLYDRNPDSDDIGKVYNCAVFDSMARGGVAGRFAPEQSGPNAIKIYDSSEDTIDAENTGAGTEFIIGSYNLPNRGNPAPGAAKIKEHKMDIVGMQEISGSYAYLKRTLSGSDYKVFPNYPVQGFPRACSGTRAIFYNSKKFKLVDSEIIDIPWYVDPAKNCPGDGGEKVTPGRGNIPIVWLQDIETDQMIIVINTHNMAYSRGDEKRYRAALQYVRKIESLKKNYPGVPIFFTGDFNEGTGVRNGGSGQHNKTYQLNHKNLLFCMFAENKLMKSADGPPMNCPNRSMGGVDYIYITPEVKVDWTKEFRDPSTSQGAHPVLFAKVVVPGSGGDGSIATVNGFTFPLKTTKAIINRGVNGASWSPSTGNIHHDYSAADIFAPTGTVVVAAFPGRVVSAKDNDGSSVGSRVTIKGDDGRLYYYAHMGDGTIRVSNGDRVKGGQPLGKVGTKADAMGTPQHLHIDVLPSQYNQRPVCSGASCSRYPFINIIPTLGEAFKALP